MIYIEYISRRPGVDLREFHETVLRGQAGWSASYTEDRLLWHAARTFRLGPEPEYITVWESPNAGLERIDAWDRIFRASEAHAYEGPARQVARIDVAGCYEPLLEPVPAHAGTYYAEFFRARAELASIRSLYERRAQRHPRLTLNLLTHRMGRLGPEPGGVAVWTIPDFAALTEIAGELDGATGPTAAAGAVGGHSSVELVAAGTYTDIGREIL